MVTYLLSCLLFHHYVEMCTPNMCTPTHVDDYTLVVFLLCSPQGRQCLQPNSNIDSWNTIEKYKSNRNRLVVSLEMLRKQHYVSLVTVHTIVIYCGSYLLPNLPGAHSVAKACLYTYGSSIRWIFATKLIYRIYRLLGNKIPTLGNVSGGAQETALDIVNIHATLICCAPCLPIALESMCVYI